MEVNPSFLKLESICHFVSNPPKAPTGEAGMGMVSKGIVPSIEGKKNAGHAESVSDSARDKEKVRDRDVPEYRTECTLDSRTGKIMLEGVNGHGNPAKTAGGPTLETAGCKPAVK